MKFPKTKKKRTETQFENAKTQFTGDLLALTGRAMRSKKSPVYSDTHSDSVSTLTLFPYLASF